MKVYKNVLERLSSQKEDVCDINERERKYKKSRTLFVMRKIEQIKEHFKKNPFLKKISQ